MAAKKVYSIQCDQIGRFIALWATFRSLWQQLFLQLWAVVVAQLVEQSLPKPEVRGSNPVIGKNLFLY